MNKQECPASREDILGDLKSYAQSQPQHNVEVDNPGAGELLDACHHSLVQARAEVIRCTPDNAAQRFSELLLERNIHHLSAGADTELLTFLEQLPDGVQLTRYDRMIEHWSATLFAEIDAGVTNCDAALADTGTLVLQARPAQPRLLSLVPPVHIAILRRQCIYANLAGWLQALDGTALPSNMVLISGPSRSADIEQVLAYGVHGPGQLIVLLIE